MKESYKIYIEYKEGIWVKIGNHSITQNINNLTLPLKLEHKHPTCPACYKD